MEINFNLSVVLICFDFRCSLAHFNAMDWRNFTPKYSDCSDAYWLLLSAKVNKKDTFVSNYLSITTKLG